MIAATALQRTVVCIIFPSKFLRCFGLLGAHRHADANALTQPEIRANRPFALWDDKFDRLIDLHQ